MLHGPTRKREQGQKTGGETALSPPFGARVAATMFAWSDGALLTFAASPRVVNLAHDEHRPPNTKPIHLPDQAGCGPRQHGAALPARRFLAQGRVLYSPSSRPWPVGRCCASWTEHGWGKLWCSGLFPTAETPDFLHMAQMTADSSWNARRSGQRDL